MPIEETDNPGSGVARYLLVEARPGPDHADVPACARRSDVMPTAAWMTTTPGQGPGPAGAAR